MLDIYHVMYYYGSSFIENAGNTTNRRGTYSQAKGDCSDNRVISPPQER